ncbi:hypothetical protein Cadr_000010760 [Camelus dromedarius]|uniref:Uncharacterized protein n=1 Tax=Camelus dromedarius TaxID=9838 RepID=A0A5N4DRC5_CAMDR|nr:hypothetical protein Cadr_000010760 [Camelus dromedarius]
MDESRKLHTASPGCVDTREVHACTHFRHLRRLVWWHQLSDFRQPSFQRSTVTQQAATPANFRSFS